VSDQRPIGVFDSGVGGLTVVRALIDDLPHESMVYFGDRARYPYGPRPLDEIAGYAVQIARYLVAQDVKLVVVACNAATSAGMDRVVDAVAVPVVGVVEPAVRAAIRATRNGRIGLIGTVATVSSGAYQRGFQRFLGPDDGGGVTVVPQACPSFVEFVERGDTTSPELMAAAGEYLGPLIAAGVDTLILGCTHYPLLRGAIHHVMGPEVLLISSAEETANDVYEALSREGLLAPTTAAPSHRFECSGDPQEFAALGRRFLGPELTHAVAGSLEEGAARWS
jgi:glutamate racemase